VLAVNPLDLSHFLLWTGDLCFVAGLVLMALISATAAVRIDPDARVPMQFGPQGKPTWLASRRLALLFAPTCAAASGLLLTYLAHRVPDDAVTQATQSLAVVRALMAFIFVVVHMLHLAFALKWLNRDTRR
jgi:hypothetical protein